MRCIGSRRTRLPETTVKFTTRFSVMRSEDLARFFDKVEITETCWLWRGSIDRKGYGSFGGDSLYALYGKRSWKAHRLSYVWFVGPIPEGLQTDHLCRVRHCVNPDHLEAVTPRENSLRGATIAAWNAAKTHCVQGHLLAGENLILPKRGGRDCRACARERNRRYLQRQREAVSIA